MDPKDDRISKLESRIQELEKELSLTRNSKTPNATETAESVTNGCSVSPPPLAPLPTVEELSAEQIERYSRQMILAQPASGEGVATTTTLGSVTGQARLLSSSVLVVGAGGLGSSAILYLAAAGIGRLGICDGDAVEVSNLQRQVVHATTRVGWNKAESAQYAVQHLNPTVQCHAHAFAVTHDNAQALLEPYDVVVDCSDNPRTRYLLNDACVLSGRGKHNNNTKKPLVSGSAVGTEGQLTVYNTGNGGGCYRCLYPRPAAIQGQCRACADAGVLGPVPGLIGTLQAMEVLKLLTTKNGNNNNNNSASGLMDQRLLMYDALAATFLTLKKPPKQQPTCPVCSESDEHWTIRTLADSFESLKDTPGPPPASRPANASTDSVLLLPKANQITCQDFNEQYYTMEEEENHILLDVRAREQFALCALPGAVHIPLAELEARRSEVLLLLDNGTIPKPVFCICRRGIDSVKAVQLLLSLSSTAQSSSPSRLQQVYNIQGGLEAWRDTVDPSFPKY